MAEGSFRNSFVHSFLAKGRLLYTHDDPSPRCARRCREMGERDREIALFRAATCVLPPLYKAHKWILTRGDVHYTALWLLYTATPLAQIEVIDAGLLVDREVIPQAISLNSALFRAVYTGCSTRRRRPGRSRRPWTRSTPTWPSMPRVLRAAARTLARRGRSPIVHRDRSDFLKTLGVEHATTACEYLADQGLIGKASIAARLTRRSNVDVQELAFFALDGDVAPSPRCGQTADQRPLRTPRLRVYFHASVNLVSGADSV